MKKRVTGIGGLFFKSEDSKASKEWYKKHLGFNTDDWGCTFWWRDNKGNKCSTQWSPFANDTDYFEPSKKDFMFNYRVENLEELLEELKKEGVTIVGETQEFDYGKFAWILDNEGNKIELWEPVDAAFKEEVKEILSSTKEKINDVFSDENVEKAKQKAETYKKNAKEKAAEFTVDAKEAFDIISEKGSEFASEAAEHLADLAEDAQDDIKEATAKVKNFLKNITGK